MPRTLRARDTSPDDVVRFRATVTMAGLRAGALGVGRRSLVERYLRAGYIVELVDVAAELAEQAADTPIAGAARQPREGRRRGA